jgi:hypothetical protein
MSESPTLIEIPENFKSTLADFVRDLSNTFPEFQDKWTSITEKLESSTELSDIFRHCLTVYPERFFDLLYQNEDIFKADGTVSTFFLPGIDFKLLYHCEGVTENTKKSIWKYLQLLLFSLVGSVKDKSNFGDTMNMFEGIDENELQSKMKETLDSIGDFFKDIGENLDEDDKEASNGEESTDEMPEFTFDKSSGMPDLKGIHEHLKGLFDGKIGRLAKNIAEEISQDFEKMLGDDYKDVRSTKDIFQKMMKNPKQMMDLIKKVGDKIKARMDAGEISKDDIMAEAGDILRKMKEMGGGSDEKLQEMLKTMAKNMGMGKNARVDMNAVNRMTKQQAMRERIRKKLDARRDAITTQSNQNFVLEQTGQSNYVFKMPEEGEQPRSIAPPPKLTDEQLIAEFSMGTTNTTSQKKKKGKSKNKK